MAMDDQYPDTERQIELPPTGGESASRDLPPGFVPLRLVLLPSGVVLEIDAPDKTLGRHSEADLRLPLPDISRRHCRFTWADGTWSVVDLGSTNGVFVNGRAVQRADLFQDDLVRIGGFAFAVDLSYPDPPRTVAAVGEKLQDVIAAVQRLARPVPQRKAS
jgi:pSer/pThr/pTyr-binding forkhead associated (FHA) protein